MLSLVKATEDAGCRTQLEGCSVEMPRIGWNGISVRKAFLSYISNGAKLNKDVSPQDFITRWTP